MPATAYPSPLRDRRFLFRQAHALGQDDAEAVEKGSLAEVGFGDAAQADQGLWRGRQDDVVGLNARQLFEDGAWGVQDRALLRISRGLFTDEVEKADEDVSLEAILALTPDRTNVQLIFLNAERRFGLGELDVSPPELLIAPIADVRTQQICSLRERGPILERGVVVDLKGETLPDSRPA